MSNGFLDCTRAPKTDVDMLLSTRDQWEYRFWPKIDKTEDCWLWNAGTNDSGYGVFGTYKLGYKKLKIEYAHRVSYVLTNKGIDNNFVVDHKCSNPLCVNPSHLHVITHLENSKQGGRALRTSNCSTCGSLKELVFRPSGIRSICRPCGRRFSRNYKRRKSAAAKKLTEF